MLMPKQLGRRSGFTIIEIIFIIVVIALLTVIAIVSYNGMQSRSQLVTARADLAAVAKAADNFTVFNGRQPVNDVDFGQILREAGLYERTRDFNSTSFAICADQNAYVIIAWNPVVDSYKNRDILYVYSAKDGQDEHVLTNSSLMSNDTVGKACTQTHSTSTYRKWSSDIP